MSVQYIRKGFTVADYYRMAEAGILTEDDHVELIEGEVIEMSPIGSRHAACVRDLTETVIEQVGGSVIVSSQSPINLGERDEPQPDVTLLKRRDDRYRDAHPTPANIFLVIEVADSSLGFDRRTKAPLYARAGIAEYVIADLINHRFEVHAEPENGEYKNVRIFRRGETFTSRELPQLNLSVDALLG